MRLAPCFSPPGFRPGGLPLIDVAWVAAAVVIANAGCHPLPNASGFASATRGVRAAVIAAGEPVLDEARRAAAAGAIDPAAGVPTRFEEAWAETRRAMDAMVDYADTVERVVSEREARAEGASRLAGAVSLLAERVAPDAEAAERTALARLSAETAAFVLGEVARHAGARSLDAALARFDPSVTRVADLVRAQLADARRLFALSINAQAQALAAVTEGDRAPTTNGYGRWLERAAELDRAAAAAADRLADASDLKVVDDETERRRRLAEVHAELDEIEAARAALAPYLDAYDARAAALRQRERSGLQVLAASDLALTEWAAAHTALAQAIRRRENVSLDALLTAVDRASDVVERWRSR